MADLAANTAWIPGRATNTQEDDMTDSTEPTDPDQPAEEAPAPEPEEGYEVDAAGTFKG